MIHINKGTQPHEWVSKKEFEEQFPELSRIVNQTPKAKEFRHTRQINKINLVTISHHTGIAISDISQFECGIKPLPDDQIDVLFKALETLVIAVKGDK